MAEAWLARLAELAQEMAQLKQGFSRELPQGALSVLGVRLGEQRVCLLLSSVDRVVGMAALEPVADASPALLGLLRTPELAIPVLCLRRLLGLEPPTFTRATAIVLLLHEGQHRGLVVDEVEGLWQIPAGQVEVADVVLPHRDLIWATVADSGRELWLLNHLGILGIAQAESKPTRPSS